MKDSQGPTMSATQKDWESFGFEASQDSQDSLGILGSFKTNGK